jgi:hypothetical protein
MPDPLILASCAGAAPPSNCAIQTPSHKRKESDPLLSHLINTNVRCLLLFQWFYDVELCMDMNTSYNNTNRLSPLGFGILRRTTAYILVGVPQGEGQGEGV